MVTPRKLSILRLAVCAIAAGAIGPGLPRQVAASPAAPTIAAVGRVSASGRLTLRITGSHFVPGSRVRFAVIKTSRWQVITKGATHAQQTTTNVICGHDFAVCSRPNPQAGTIAYRMHLGYVPRALLTWVCGHEHAVCARPNPQAADNFLVLYRASGDSGMQPVTLQ